MAEPIESELRMDPANLYREDVFTDRKIGTIRQLVPITADGATDPSRTVLFAGSTQILTGGGMLPLNFEIPVATLADAVREFGTHAGIALEETIREIQEMQRQQASQLVIPEPGSASSILNPGGMPAGRSRLR